MIQAQLDQQLMISVNNQVGTLAEVNHVISASGINLIAVCAYAVDNKGLIMFVSEDNPQAKQLLMQRDYDVREEEVIVVSLDNKPGTLQSVTNRVSELGVDVTLIYGSVDQKGKKSRVVLISEDNQAVLMALKTLK